MQNLTKREERVKLALLGYHAGIYEWNMIDDSAYYSEEWMEMLGITEQENVASNLSTWKNLVHPDDIDEVMQNVRSSVKNHLKNVETIHRLKHTNGDWIWILGRGLIEYDVSGLPIRMTGIHTDITAQRVYKLQLIHQAQIIEQIHDSVISTDLNGKILTWNRGSELLFGYTKAEAISQAITMLHYPQNIEKCIQSVESLKTKDEIHKEVALKTKKDNRVYVDLTLSLLKDINDNTIGIIASAQDITQRKEMEEELNYRAYHDTLTNLPNRALFNDRLELSMKKAKRNNSKIALFFIDLDKFKEINDNYGHDIGDQVLQQVAKVIQKFIREGDTLSRIGGDEFLLILDDLQDTMKATNTLAKKILGALSEPILSSSIKNSISASIGISIYPDDAKTDVELIKYADDAMYKAKLEGRNNFQYFNNSPL